MAPPPSSDTSSLVLRPRSPDCDGFAVWRAKVQNLTAQQRKQFLERNHDDLASYLTDFESLAKKQSHHHTHRIAAKVKPLWELSKVLTPIASDPFLSQIDPAHCSLILGGISFLLSFSGRFLDFYDRVLELLADMLERLPLVEKIELLHADRPDPDLKDAAVNICADVLQYCVEASDLFVDENGRERSSARLLFSSVQSSFEDKFGTLKCEFERHVQLFDTYAQLAMARRQVGFMRDREKRDVLEDERALRRAERDRQMESAEEMKRQEKKRRDLLERIPSMSLDSLQRVQDDRLERCLEGTGQWLLDHETFQSWIRSPASELLWVHGKPGCGKSHLAALTIEFFRRTQHREGDAALAYIYCNPIDTSRAIRDSGASNDISASIDLDRMIGTLLKQLLERIPPSVSLPSLDSYPGLSGDGRPTRQQMKAAIIDALAKIQNAFVVIDGLDECHKLGASSFARFCDFIGSLRTGRRAPAETKIKTIVFSRPKYAEIESAFLGVPSIQVDSDTNSEDIALFVKHNISGLKFSESFLREISGELVSRADGLFLWVDLVSKTLKNELNKRGIRKAIEDLPEDLHDVYEWSMERIFRQDRVVRDRAFDILLWITNARRPLSREELLEALAVEAGMTELDEETRLISDDGFVTECADLVVLRDGCYEPLHMSLKEYLEKTPERESTSPALKSYSELQKKAQEKLAEACLTYLNFTACQRGPFDTIGGYQQFLNDNPFFRYASLSWGHHVGSTQDRGLAELALRLLSSAAARETCMQHIFQVSDEEIDLPRPFPFWGGCTAMHMLAILGQKQLAQDTPHFWPSIYEEDGYGNLPFKYATLNSSSDMCHFILDLDENPEVRAASALVSPVCWSKDALHCAAMRDWQRLTERLITRGVDLNSATDEWAPPLHVAADCGSLRALRTLLIAGSDPNILTLERETPLTLASARNEKDTVALLIEKGADVNVNSGHRDETPLHTVAGNGNIEIARLLLDNGSDVNAVDRLGFTPVGRAALNGKLEMVQMFIHDYHADPKATCRDGTDILHLAVASGNCELASFLLDLGLKPTVSQGDQYSVLHSAAIPVNAPAGSVNMLKMLLKRFPDMDLRATTTDGETPLHIAASFGSLDVVQYLHETDPSLVTVCTSSAGLPLHRAAREGRLDCAKELITFGNVDAEGPQRRTPLLEAASSGHFSLVELLVQKGANLEKADADGRTPLLAAAENGHLAAVDYLIQHGAITTKTDSEGFGLLLNLLDGGYFSAAEGLLQKGVEVNLTTSTGVTPLLLAAELNCTRVVRRLLDLGADHTVQLKKDGQTAFLRAVSCQRTATVRLFEQRGIADYCAVDKCGASAVRWAVRRSNLSMLRRFLGSDTKLAFEPDSRGVDCLSDAAADGSDSTIPFLFSLGFKPDGIGQHPLGLTPLSHAAWNGKATTIRLLIKAGADVNRVSSAPWHRNSGHWAAGNAKSRTTKTLLQAGINMQVRDALGYSVADYVQQSGFPWQRKQCAARDTNYKTMVLEKLPNSSDEIRCMVRRTIRDCAATLLNLDDTLINDPHWQQSATVPPSQAGITELLRQHHVACLGLALDRLHHFCPGEENNRLGSGADAVLCLQEVIQGPCPAYGICWDICDICDGDLGGAAFRCTTCHEIFICPDCHADYIKHGRAVPQSYQVLSTLEEEVSPIRVAFEPLCGNVKLLAESLLAHPRLEGWVRSRQSTFGRWAVTYTLYSARNPPAFSENPARRFTTLLARVVKLWRESVTMDRPAETRPDAAPQRPAEPQSGMQETDEDKWLVLSNDLMDLYIFHSPEELYGELPESDWCKGHEFVKIPAFSDLAEEQKALFDSDKRLKSDFFRDLLLRYPPVNVGATEPEPDLERLQVPCQGDISIPSDQSLSVAEPGAGSDGDGEACSLDGTNPPKATGEAGKMGGHDNEEKALVEDEDDDSLIVESLSKEQVDEIERRLDEVPPTSYPKLIGERVSLVLKADAGVPRLREALRAREYISLIAERVGPWPPLEDPE